MAIRTVHENAGFVRETIRSGCYADGDVIERAASFVLATCAEGGRTYLQRKQPQCLIGLRTDPPSSRAIGIACSHGQVIAVAGPMGTTTSNPIPPASTIDPWLPDFQFVDAGGRIIGLGRFAHIQFHVAYLLGRDAMVGHAGRVAVLGRQL